jgi:hypothetical protein
VSGVCWKTSWSRITIGVGGQSLVEARGSGRRSVSFFAGTMVGEFGVKEPVPDTFPPSGTFRSTPVGTDGGAGGGIGVADSGLRRISSISFLRDPIIS